MYQKDLKKFDIRELKKLITAMKRGRDATQKSIDIAENARVTKKGNIGAKSRGELKKALRFYERSINAAEVAKSKIDGK